MAFWFFCAQIFILAYLFNHREVAAVEGLGEVHALSTFVFRAKPTWGGTQQVEHRTGITWESAFTFRGSSRHTVIGWVNSFQQTVSVSLFLFV